jgi:hypothetical protein
VEIVLEQVRSSWICNGMPIILNGWTDTTNRTLVNIVLMSPSSSYYLRAVDASCEEKEIEWNANKISEAIEAVGPSNLVQVIKDNAHLCKATSAIMRLGMNIFLGPHVWFMV